ncbi:DUF1534 domain-containing protein [Pseudomonas syringae]|nr:DUF1534 domain-containing protein [Pseudomonas syringae]MCF5473311.1 DUF1534 domain-containing protein [Pseudomonas syringae]MCF5483326.1 DUF1534 domain-containing protein [Pseudomonas syringae]MCF5487278.1 DUF1534 domain-containing protein [Pseudomonas syringae]MCF5494633.1 DUF1534 domain-containing protein [Pseudomonas syringae]
MRLSFLTLRRGNAVRDALRHPSPWKSDAERPELHADAERRTIVGVIVPHAPAWECRS